MEISEALSLAADLRDKMDVEWVDLINDAEYRVLSFIIAYIGYMDSTSIPETAFLKGIFNEKTGELYHLPLPWTQEKLQNTLISLRRKKLLLSPLRLVK